MNRSLALVLAGVVLGAGVWTLTRREDTAAAGEASSSSPPSSGPWSSVQDAIEDAVQAVKPGPWTPPGRAAPYLQAIYEAEAAIGAPHNMIARLIYQETHFRPEIIDGRVRSKVGATGIGQFMPAVSAAYGIDPTDPFQSIPKIGEELAALYKRFGAWPDAIAAYNWGQGNWNAFLRTGKGAKGQDRPQENVDYVAGIAGDLGIA